MSRARHYGDASCTYKLRLGEKCRRKRFLHNSFYVSISLLRIMVEHQWRNTRPYLARFGPVQPLKCHRWPFALLAFERPLPNSFIPDSDFSFLSGVCVEEKRTQNPAQFLFGRRIWRVADVSRNGHTETEDVTVRVVGSHIRKWKESNMGMLSRCAR